ncbi:MAG: oxidoreductase [Segetibacter sp.]|nr:oxidoreductase [Segetibacter sp.]
MMQQETVKFAVVGAGHIGKRHIEMIERNSDARLMAVIDIKPQNSLNLPIKVPFFNSLEAFLESSVSLDVDVITIATPNGYHASQALKSLEAKKHVVLEKPIALCKQDAERIIYKALNVHKHVFSVMQNRYSPPSAWLKKVVDSGILGNIYIVQLNCYWNRDDRYYTNDTWHGKKDLDGGTLFTQFSHFIDILYWIFGDITNIISNVSTHNHHTLTEFEDSGFVHFDFVNQGSGCLSFSTSVWDRNLESSITVIAENGSIKIGGQYMEKVEVCHVKNYEMPQLAPTNPGNDYGVYKGSAANHHYVIENVINVLKNGSVITTNALEGLKVVEIIQRIYQEANN